jgi:hypothetical protein
MLSRLRETTILKPKVNLKMAVLAYEDYKFVDILLNYGVNFVWHPFGFIWHEVEYDKAQLGMIWIVRFIFIQRGMAFVHVNLQFEKLKFWQQSKWSLFGIWHPLGSSFFYFEVLNLTILTLKKSGKSPDFFLSKSVGTLY